MAAAVVHLGLAAQVVGQVQVVWAAAVKEQTEIQDLFLEIMAQQTPAAVVVVVMTAALAAPAAAVLSLLNTEFRMDLHYFHLMQMVAPVVTLQVC